MPTYDDLNDDLGSAGTIVDGNDITLWQSGVAKKAAIEDVATYVLAGATTPDADDIAVSDDGEYFASDSSVEDVFQEIGALLPTFVGKSGGGGETINALASVSGATELDLSLGNIQFISSSSGTHTLSVSNPAGEGLVAFALVSDASHAPTFFGTINWINGVESIAWDGTREVFTFWSLDGGSNWIGWHMSPTAPIEVEYYSVGGTLTTGTGAHRIYNDSGADRTIVAARASVGTAPTGDSILVDVNVNGTTIFTTQGNRPEIAISENTNKTTTVDAGSWDDGEYVTVDIDQIGSSTEGSDLTVAILYQVD